MSSFSVKQLAIKYHEARAAAQRFPVVHRLRRAFAETNCSQPAYINCRNAACVKRMRKMGKMSA